MCTEITTHSSHLKKTYLPINKHADKVTVMDIA